MNPVIIQRKNLQKKLWEDLRPRNEEQVQAEITYQRYGFYDESGFNLPIEADTTISYQYKRIGGIDIKKFGVPASQFIEGNRKRVQMFINGRMMGSNAHPYDAIRTEALYIFASSKDARELSSRMYPLVCYIDQYTD